MGSGDEGAPGKGKRPARFADHGKARARRPRIDEDSPNHGGYEEEKEGDRRRRRQREDTQFSDDENMVTADEGEEEEEEEDEEVARQLGPRSEIKKRKQLNPAGRPAEVGILVKIYCENFMCHRKLSVTLCPNVNFINGANGSGKSAILAALQICLGARATVTHRGSRLSQLIREGHDGHALVRVTLLNRGSDAFKPEEYGEYITVERKIERSGSGGYRLLKGNPHQPHALHLVSNKKEDLEAMLDRFNIQIENPCALLDQENAKNFIGGSSQDKYRFFLRATELDRLNRHLINSREKLEEAEEELKQNAESVQELKRVWKEAEKKVQDVEGLEKIEQDLKRAKVESAWAQLQKAREEAEHVEIIKIGVENRVAEADKLVVQYEQKKANAEQEVTKHEEQLKSLQQQNEEAKDRVRAVKQRLADAKGPLQQYETAIKSKVEEIRDNLRRKKAAQKKLDDEREKLASEAQGETEGQLRELKEIEEKLADAEVKFESRKQENESMRQHMGQMDQEGARLEREFHRLAEDLRKVEKERQELNNNKDELAAYGRNMINLVRDIRANARNFQELPLGPVGSFVKVKDENREWRQSIENAIGSMMNSFVVTSKKDQDLMAHLIRKHGTGGTAVFVQKFPPINLQAVPSIPVVAALIQVENGLVWNALVDWAKIDKSCVFRDRKQVDDFLRTNKRTHLPGGVNTVYFPDNMSLKIAGNGTKFFSPVNRPTNQPCRLGVDTRELMQEYDTEIAKMNESKKRMMNDGKGLEQEHKKLAQQADSHKKEAHQLRGEIQRLKARKADLTQEIEDSRAASANNQVDLSDLEREIESYDQRIKEAQEEHKAHQLKANEIKANLGPLQAEEKDELRRTGEIKEGLSRMEKAASNLLTQMNDLEDKMQKAKRATDAYKKQLQECDTEIKKREATVAETLEGARVFTKGELPDWDGEEIKTNKSIEALDKEINKHKRRLERERQQHNVTESLDVLREKCERAKRAYKDKGKAIRTVKESIGRLGRGYEARKRKAINLRKHIVRQSTSHFDNTLQIKGQSGGLVFSHKEQTLELTVQKDNRDESTQSRNVKELSGGERSYSTLALLVALGESIECPFRVMDEFDIFMDSVSRKTALDVLLTTAKAHLHRQYIFITPQNLDAVQESDVVKIWKLRPPERSGPGLQQTTL